MEWFSTILFFAAVVHVFFADRFIKKAEAHRNKAKKNEYEDFIQSSYLFLGNITLIFGIWLVPVVIYMMIEKGGQYTFEYIHSMNIQEPFAYFVLLTLATIRPVRQLYDNLVRRISRAFGNTLMSWWLTVLLFSMLLTGCFSGVTIMALASYILGDHFFRLRPSHKLAYFSVALLLIGLAVGNTVIPINFNFFIDFLNSGTWGRMTVFKLFGLKVFVAFAAMAFAGARLFRREFSSMQKEFKQGLEKIPRISAREIFYAVLLLIASSAKNNPYFLLMIISIVIILHKFQYRRPHEEGKLNLALPLLIGFFTYTLELHASLQKWWVLPLFEKLHHGSLYFVSFFLTGLNEHVPLQGLKDLLSQASLDIKFYSYLAVLAGGGITIIATSANIVAKKILATSFHRTLSPFMHMVYAIPLALLFFGIVALLHLIIPLI